MLWLALCGGLFSACVQSAAPLPAAAATAAQALDRVKDVLPVAAFARLDFVEQASLSPDGKYMAGALGIDGEQRIAILSIFKGGDKPLVIPIADQTSVMWMRWVNDDNVIVGVRALHFIGAQRAYITRVIAINRIKAKVTRLLWNKPGQNASDVLWVPSDGSNEILLAVQKSIYVGAGFWPAIYRVDVTDGSARQVADGRYYVNYWEADAAGVVRAGVGHDDFHNVDLLYYRRDKDSQLHAVDHADLAKREALIYPFLFLPGGDDALAFGDDRKGNRVINQYDMTTMARVSTFYAPDRGMPLAVILSRDQSRLLGVTLNGSYPTHWFDPKLAQAQADLEKALPDTSVSIESMSADRSKMLVRSGGADMPGSLYYFDTAERALQHIAFTNEIMRDRRLAKVETITYQSRDGLQIEAKVTLPTGRAAKALPTVVLPHGGPWAHDDMSYDYWSHFLANRGYLVIQPNFRGSDGYGTAFERRGEGQLGLAMQDDVTDAVRWAVGKGRLADPGRVCIMGGSYGGYAAMWGIVKDPDEYRCAISIAGVASLSKQQHIFSHSINDHEARLDWARMTPDFAAVSPINFVDKIKTPCC